MQDFKVVSVERQGYREGMVEGISAWLAYGILECVFSVILPYLLQPKYNFVQVHWMFQACLLAAYALIGAVVGLVIAVVVGWVKPWREKRTVIISALATCSVITAVCANFAFEAPGKQIYLAAVVAIGVVLIFAEFYNVRVGGRNRFLRITVNRWMALALLLGVFWINSEIAVDLAIPVKAGFFAAYLIGITLIGIALDWMVREVSLPELVKGRISPLALLTVYAILMFGMVPLLRQEPIVAGSSAKTASREVSGMPNIIIITMDTVRADHLSLYGYERDTSPNLCELAKQATVYTQAIAPGDMTLTSHASLFTGMYAVQHGAYSSIPDYPGGRPINKSVRTMAEILLDRGYSTMAVVANVAYLTRSFGFDRGFQYYDQNSRPRFLERRTNRHFLKVRFRGVILKIPLQVPWEWESKYRQAGVINREVFKLLDSQKARGERPFFLFVNYMDAHRPYTPPPPYDSRYPGKEMASFNQTRFEALKDKVFSSRQTLKDGERQYLISQYDGGIAHIDARIGELIAYLMQIESYDNSVLIITSDHGEAFGEGNLLEHGCAVYQHQVHVPLIMADPNSREKRVVEKPVSLVDLLPTVLDFVEARDKVIQRMEGRSLREMQAGVDGYVITESYPIGWYKDYPRMRRIERAIISGSFKFITSTAGKKELYDLSKDPGEKKNLYRVTDDISQRLESTMSQWIKTAIPPSAPPMKVDKNAIENLKSLGYIK